MKNDNQNIEGSSREGMGLAARLKESKAAAFHGAQRALIYLRKHWIRSLLCIAFFGALYLLINLTVAVFLTGALVVCLLEVDSRFAIGLFAIFLAACVFFLAMNARVMAERAGVWAFFFLFIGIIGQIANVWRNGRRERALGDAATLVPRRTESRLASFIQENLASALGYMIIATFAANFLNYLFNVASGRLLGPDAYGEFAALLSIFMIVTVPTSSLQAMLAKMVAEFHHEDDKARTKEIAAKCLQICLYSAVAMLLAFLVLSRPLANFLHISDVTPVILCGFAVAVTILAPVFYGVMQGYQWFTWLGSIMVAYALGRFVFGWLLIEIGWGVSGAILGGAFSSLVTIAISAFLIRGVFSQGGVKGHFLRGVFSQNGVKGHFRLRDIGRSFLPFILSSGIFLLLVSIDQVIVKRKFSSSIAGDYAAAAFLGKIILYLPSSVGIVLFPRFVEAHVGGKNARGLLWKGIMVVLAGSLILSAFFIAFPVFTVTKLYGADYVGASSILRIISIAMTGYTLVNIFIYYFLAIEDNKFLLVSLSTCMILGISAMYLIATSSFQVALIQFMVSMLFVITAFLHLGRTSIWGSKSRVDKDFPER